MVNTQVEKQNLEDNNAEDAPSNNTKFLAQKRNKILNTEKKLSGNKKRALFQHTRLSNRVNKPHDINIAHKTKAKITPQTNEVEQKTTTLNTYPNKQKITKQPLYNKPQKYIPKKTNPHADSKIAKVTHTKAVGYTKNDLQDKNTTDQVKNYDLPQFLQKKKIDKTEKFERDKLARKINELNQKEKHCYYVYEDKLRPQLITTKYELAKKANILFYSAVDNKLNETEQNNKHSLPAPLPVQSNVQSEHLTEHSTAPKRNLFKNKESFKNKTDNSLSEQNVFKKDNNGYISNDLNKFNKDKWVNNYKEDYQTPNDTPTRLVRPPKDGIKTNNKGFITSWWALSWLKNIETYIHSPQRLNKGKQYAKDGHITQINIDKGQVKALVQGNHLYSVNIKFAPLKEKAWHIIGRVLGSQAALAARLLNGELPEEVSTALNKVGLSLIPNMETEFQAHCSCSEREKPCKHVLAVYYLLTEEIERYPLLLFKLRGKERRELIALILNSASKYKEVPTQNNHKVDDEPIEIEDTENIIPNNTKTNGSSLSKILNTSSEPLPTIPDLFWGKILSIQALPTFEQSDAPEPPNTLLKQLGEFPFWRGDKDLNEALNIAYQLAVKNNDDTTSSYL